MAFFETLMFSHLQNEWFEASKALNFYQSERFPMKLLVPLNIALIPLTADTSQSPMSWLNSTA